MQRRLNLTGGQVFTLFLLALNSVYLAAAFQIRVPFDEGLVGPRFLPYLASGITYPALLVVFINETRRSTWRPAGSSLRAPAVIVLITAAYVVLFEPLGYVLSTFLFSIGLFHMFDFKRGQPIQTVLYAAGVTLVFYLLFGVAFHVRLPLVPGVL